MSQPYNQLTRLVRVVGAMSLTMVSLVAVDMPGGYLGGADVLSPFGRWYTLAILVVVAFLALSARVGRWPRWTALFALAANVGVFVPAMPNDPVVSVMVIVWHLIIIGFEMFEVDGRKHRRRTALQQLATGTLDPESHRVTVHLAAVGSLLALIIVGYHVSSSPIVVSMAILITLIPAVVALMRRARIGQPVRAVLGALFLVAVVGAYGPTGLLGGAALLNIAIVGSDVAQGELFREILQSFLARPAVLIIITFAGIIAIGTLLLTFPASSAMAHPVKPIDALFTATSAVCVTGLVVLNTPKDFSFFGQVVIFGLFQIGGLGFMVFSTFATVLLGSRLGVRGERALSEVLDIRDPGSAYRLVKFIIATTVCIEAVGAALLAWRFWAWGRTWDDALWAGVFHAVSAFCNAGFALQSDSLVRYTDDPVILCTVMALITFGGLGFTVLAAMWQHWVLRTSRHLDVQARVVLLTSAVLTIGGGLLYLGLEWDTTLAGSTSVFTRFVNAMFQSVTLRTAGFNSVSYDALRAPSAFLMIILMFIGASPGSTGGGIKTTTFAVLVAAVRGILTGTSEARVFGREIPEEIVYRSAAITVLSAAFLFTGIFVLLIAEPQIGFLPLVFESVSAIGTVGLSLGATTMLGSVGKFVICVLMFAGRVGFVTLALVLSRNRKLPHRLPRASIMVG